MNVSKPVALAFWIGAAAAAQTAAVWPDGAHDGKVWDIAISGNYAYVADGPGGLKILDVSDPAAPVLVNSVVTNDIRAVEVVDGYAYAACYNELDTVNSEGVMLIFDVSRPADVPAPVASSPVSYDGYLDIAVENGYAYLVDKDLEIWNVSDPGNPGRVKASSTSGFANSIKVIDGTAYIAEGQAGLCVYDLSKPSSLYSIAIPSGTYDPGNYAYGVDVEGTTAYYANRQGGLVVVDVSDPSNLLPLGSYGDSCEKVCVDGSIACITDNQGDVQILDVSDPANIVHITTFSTDGDSRRLTIDSGVVYAANGTNGLSIIDLRPELTAISVNSPSGSVQLQVDGLFRVPCAVDCAASLDGEWMPFCSTNPPSMPFLVQDYVGSDAVRFYRLRPLSGGYADEVRVDAPAAYYRFNEAAAAPALADSSGNGHDSLVLSNVTFGAEGLLDGAAAFSNSYALLDFSLSPDAGDFTIEAIARFDATDVNRHIASQQDGVDGQGRSLLYRTEDGPMCSYLGGSSSSSSDFVGEGAWHHVVMTVDVSADPDVIRFYIDGKAAGEQTETIEYAEGYWVLGAAKGYANGLIGAIDELAVYTHVLSAKRIAEHVTALTASDAVPGVMIAR